MTNEEKKTLIKYRLDRAYESAKAAELMLEHELYIPAMNRIYYSMFYSVQSLFILENKSFSKHGQVKGYFNKEYIKSGIFPKEYGKLFNTVFEYRQKFDYVDLVIPDKGLIIDYLAKAKGFISTISEFVNNKINQE